MDNNEFVIQSLKANKLSIDILIRCVDRAESKINKLHALVLVGAIGLFATFKIIKNQKKKISKLENDVEIVKKLHPIFGKHPDFTGEGD